ncbi:hypothetical protein FCIRC_11486 [Fusarium circinatum]|uniref:Uncharacterized protein n=1 Tax=Fusarium circinatum TaxID=48490 RepID=A0A8H5WJS2_FUSCI|nr:hypothetical protein FCIRC_11486 [Fusarium circinatum]
MFRFQDLLDTTASHAYTLGAVLVVALLATLARSLLAQPSKRASREIATPAKPFVRPTAAPTDYTADSLPDPILYRPFRHGPNFITMGIRRLDWDRWIEMDKYYPHYHDIKAAELKKDFEGHVKFVDTPELRLACFEVYDEVTGYLTERYPNIFSIADGFLRNAVTGGKFAHPPSMSLALFAPLPQFYFFSGQRFADRIPLADPHTAMANAALCVQEDLIIMAKEDDGQYHLDGAAVCLPGFWRLREKYRMSLDTLHIEAGVPHYQEKLQKSMNRYFDKMGPENTITRNNLDDGLQWSHRMGPQNGSDPASWVKADDNGITIEDLHFRSERQTLRRLPKSGVLLFTVRTYFEPICKIAQEPHVPGRLAEAIRSWDDSVSYYKGKSHWDKILLPYLDEQHKKQESSGLLTEIPEGEFPL